MTERTLVLLKPETIMRGLMGVIISRIEKIATILSVKLVQLSYKQAQQLYHVHREKPFFDSLLKYMTSGPVLAMVIEGKNVVSSIRSLIGDTDPTEASHGTIRREFGLDTQRNVIHAADSPQNAKREITIFFQPDEILQYTKPT